MRAYKNNSLYALNKIDRLYDEKWKNKYKDVKYYIETFLNILTKENKNNENIINNNEEEGLGVDLNKNVFLKLSSMELFNEINLYSDFKIYISYIVN